MKPSVKQSTHKTKTTNTRRASLLRRRAEGEPTTSSPSSRASASSRFVESVRGVLGRSPGLSCCSEVGTARPSEAGERSELPLDTNLKGRGLRCLSRASPWHPQAGAG